MYRTLMLSSLWLVVSFTVVNAQTFQEVVESEDKDVWYAYLAKHDMNACHEDLSLLSAAAKTGNIPLLKVLLRAGANVDQSCSGKETPLMLATAYSQNHAAKMLLRSGADPMHQDALQRNTFDLALENENFPLFNHLIRTDGHSLAEPDGPFLFRQEGNRLAHLQIVKSKKNKIRTVTAALEGPFYYNKVWKCHDKDGEELFSFNIRKKPEPVPAEFASPEKLLAISDIEGNFDAFANLLKGNEVINDDYEWTYGRGHLVLVGDFFDRGPQVTEALWLVYKLEAEAEKAGGRVHFILGNHETMNLRGDFRYVEPKYFVHASLFNLQYAHLYAPNSILGEWLRTKNTMVKIGETLFCHGGISQDFAKRQLSIKRVNDLTRKYIDADPVRVRNDDAAKAIFNTSKGILWYRGYVQKKTNSEKVAKSLDFYEARNIVVGHTPVNEISQLYDGRVIAIDVPHNMGEEHQQALLIEYNQMYAVGMHGKRRLLNASTAKITP
ncbi:MAG: metallophosphoesterase [Saprospiraceae bacterium]|nr:metallophosphoesterase [Saprospiraceae bacterium]